MKESYPNNRYYDKNDTLYTAEPAAAAAPSTTPPSVRVCDMPSIYASNAMPVLLNITAMICETQE